MKKFGLVLIAVALASCANKVDQEPVVQNPITISSPSPTTQITKVALTETQKGYVSAGNTMAFRCLKQLYAGENLIFSPLSLQYALAMTANGASGETLQEIIGLLGYGADGIDALNQYSKILLEQLPAVDLNVQLKVTDALLVNDQFPLLPSFKKTVEDYYYAAVDNMSFADAAQIAARINDWSRRNTNGFIDKVLDPSDISDDAVAFLMNALYFKARWAGSDYDPMFGEWGTADEKFTLSDGTVRTVSMMNNVRYHKYAVMDGYKVVAIPYAGCKFYMYILLPDSNDIAAFMDRLPSISWSAIMDSLVQDAEVYLKLPKFDIENKFVLNNALKALGVTRSFDSSLAQFDGMFQPKDKPYVYWIGSVIQKARIGVDEWGTEAAAVTVVEMEGATSAGPGEEPKRINFYADHPFAFVIAESTSRTILFEGVYTGK